MFVMFIISRILSYEFHPSPILYVIEMLAVSSFSVYAYDLQYHGMLSPK